MQLTRLTFLGLLFIFIGPVFGAINIDGSTGVKPLVVALSASYRNQQSAVPIMIGDGLKPQARIEALKRNRIQIAMASHGIDTRQIETQGLVVHRIAKVAVVMGVNRDVEVNSVTYQQLCDIYSGKSINWQELGGNDKNIMPFVRPSSEVDIEVVSAFVPCFRSLSYASAEVKEKSGHMAKALALNSGAVGMTTMVRVAQSMGNIKPLAINGIHPTSVNIQNASYRLTRDLFLITHREPAQEVLQFLDFIRSKHGVEIILSNNAVPAH